MNSTKRILAITTIVAGVSMASHGFTNADGTETLGPPSIPIAVGTAAVADGTGMWVQPAAIQIDVPLDATVVQVIAYWEGQHSAQNVGFDAVVQLDGTDVSGTKIGGATRFFGGQDNAHWSSTYRADVTALGLVAPGGNVVTASGMDFDRVSNGLGLLVIYDDGGPAASIDVVDGNDLAYFDFAPPLDTTVPQTLAFDPAEVDREVEVIIFASSVEGPDLPGHRPNVISVTVDGVETRHQNLLDSNDGNEWDTVTIQVDVPAGVDSLTVQALSVDDANGGDRPASFAWLASVVVAPGVPPTTTTTTTTVPPTTTTTTTVPPTTTTTTTIVGNLPPTTTTTVPPTTSTTSTSIVGNLPPTTTTTTTVPPTTFLPRTGNSESATLLWLGASLVAAGFGMLVLGRRRPAAD